MRVAVDGVETEVSVGSTLLGALEVAGVHVPTLCHDPRLTPQGSCGICMVEVKRGEGWIQTPACATPATDGMEIRIDSEPLTRTRRWTLELLFSNHSTAARYYPQRKIDGGKPPLVCACKGHESCALRSLCLDLEAEPDRLEVRAESEPPEELRPGIELEMSKCIRCDRCVRICREVAGVEALGFAARGRDTTLVFAMPGTPDLRDRCDRCVETGALCIDTCPTDALHQPRRKSGLKVL
jgi:NADH dehydrogenase/NADH:ubiquinone oxidoreductase subunit G